MPIAPGGACADYLRNERERLGREMMAAMTAAAPAAAPVRLVDRGSVMVWMMSAVAGAVTVGLCFFLADASSLAGIAVPWWALAPLFYVTERHLVRVHFRRHEHSFSLGEIPLVLGLFFVAPVELVLAQLVGSLAAVVLHREEKLVKAVFNLAHFCLEATLAGALAVWLAIAATGGAPRWRRFVQLLGFGIVVAVMNGSFGLLAVSVLWSSPESAWLLIVPGAMTFFAYRLYTSEREKKVRLEFLYRSTRTLQRSADNELDVPALLASIRDMFGAGRAEMVLLPVTSGSRPTRTVLGRAAPRPVSEGLDGEA